MLAVDRVFGNGPQSLEALTLEREVDLWQEILGSCIREGFVDETQLLDVARSMRVCVAIAELERDHTLDLYWKVVHGTCV